VFWWVAWPSKILVGLVRWLCQRTWPTKIDMPD
jgi:hypothetical protein